MSLALFLLVACPPASTKDDADSAPALPDSGTDTAADLDTGSPGTGTDDSGSSDSDPGDSQPQDDGDSGAPGDPDHDGDGYPASIDCDDDDAGVFPVTFMDGSSSPSDATAIFDGGSAGAPASVVLVDAGEYRFCDGLYYVTVSISAENVTLSSVNGAAVTTLSAEGHGSVTRLESAVVSLSLHDLTLSGGAAANGGAVDNTVGGTVSLTNTVVDGNTATSCGGGIVSYDGYLTLDNSDVINNSASSAGGGICCADCFLSVTASDISGNAVGNRGGGLYLGGFSSTMTVTGSTISNNTATAGGGAWHEMSSPRYQDSYITDNVGGGFTVYWSANTVVDCTGGSGGVLRNTENGASMDYAAWFSSVDCDWGTGADDNTPYDVNYGYSYGANATFSCGWVEGCS